MAEQLTKRYLDTAAAEALVTNIKAEDVKTLNAAKAYADGLAGNYDASGAAATALKDAKDYTDLLANGAVANNSAAIAKLNGDATTEGSVSKAIADAKALIDADVDAVEAKVDKNAEDIAAINAAETGILAQAKKFATDEDAKVQGAVDALAGKVGTVPEGSTVMGIIDQIQENAYDDTALKAEINGKLDLKADKTQVATDIETAVNAEKSARETAVAGVQGEIDALEQTHTTDKAALEAAIALKADQTALNAVSDVANAAVKQADYDVKVAALEDEDERIAGLVATEKARAEGVESDLDERLEKVEAFFVGAAEDEGEGENLKNALDTLVEIQTYINNDGAAADAIVKDIADNKKAIEDHIAQDHNFAAADKALKSELTELINAKASQDDLDAVEGRMDTAEGKITAAEGKITTLEGQMTTAQQDIAKKVDQTAYETKIGELVAADEGLAGRIEDLEEIVGESGSIAQDIEDAKDAAIEAAKADATEKANQALADAKAYADAEDAKIETRVDALEAASATHALASDVTALTGRVTTVEGKVTTLEGEMDDVQEAVATKAAQADLTALTTRVTTAEGEIDTLQSEMDAVEKKASDNADAIAALVKTHGEDKTTLEAAIAANTSAINSFVAISAEEINGMFA